MGISFCRRYAWNYVSRTISREDNKLEITRIFQKGFLVQNDPMVWSLFWNSHPRFFSLPVEFFSELLPYITLSQKPTIFSMTFTHPVLHIKRLSEPCNLCSRSTQLCVCAVLTSGGCAKVICMKKVFFFLFEVVFFVYFVLVTARQESRYAQENIQLPCRALCVLFCEKKLVLQILLHGR